MECDIDQHHYQACNTMDKKDVWWPRVHSCWSMGMERSSQLTDVHSMVEKTEPWTSAMYHWWRTCQSFVANLTSCSSVLYAYIISNPCQRCWQTEWLLNSFAVCMNFGDINCWFYLFYTYCLTNWMVKVLRHRDRKKRFSMHIVFTLKHLWRL